MFLQTLIRADDSFDRHGRFSGCNFETILNRKEVICLFRSNWDFIHSKIAIKHFRRNNFNEIVFIILSLAYRFERFEQHLVWSEMNRSIYRKKWRLFFEFRTIWKISNSRWLIPCFDNIERIAPFGLVCILIPLRYDSVRKFDTYKTYTDIPLYVPSLSTIAQAVEVIEIFSNGWKTISTECHLLMFELE